jgi:hypothetical protein
MSSQQNVQTVGEATSSISQVVQSSFTSLANMLGLHQLKESFFQNIIYILIVIIILIGILVYIEMVGSSGSNPLSSPPTTEIKKIEIKKIVEGFDVDSGFNTTENTAAIDEVGVVENYANYNDNDNNGESNNNFLDDYSGGGVKQKHVKKYKTPFPVEEAFFNRRSEY